MPSYLLRTAVPWWTLTGPGSDVTYDHAATSLTTSKQAAAAWQHYHASSKSPPALDANDQAGQLLQTLHRTAAASSSSATASRFPTGPLYPFQPIHLSTGAPRHGNKMDYADVLYVPHSSFRRCLLFPSVLVDVDLANTSHLNSRIVNLAMGVLMVLGGISQFFPISLYVRTLPCVALPFHTTIIKLIRPCPLQPGRHCRLLCDRVRSSNGPSR